MNKDNEVDWLDLDELKSKTNFERIKSVDNAHEMTDLIMYVISARYSEIIKKDGTIDGIPVLRWLQEEVNKN